MNYLRLFILATIFFFFFSVSQCVDERTIQFDGQKILTYKLVEPKEERSEADYYLKSKIINIATDSIEASEAGYSIFKQGGNVIDIAVCISFVLSVTRPQSTGLGGGGFLLYHNAQNNQTKAFDFREHAPLRTYPKYYNSRSAEASLFGQDSIATPGMIRGLVEIHQKYGKLPLTQVLEPAYQLAKEGFIVYQDLENSIRQNLKNMDSDMKKIFLPENHIPKTGFKFKQKDLAESLKLIMSFGYKPFYTGKPVNQLLNKIQKGSPLSKEDFGQYTIKVTDPIQSKYRNWIVKSMPPPSSGVHIHTMLNILENRDLEKMYNTSNEEFYQFLIEVLRIGYLDRIQFGGDPKFQKIPIEKLISDEYAYSKFKLIKDHKTDYKFNLKQNQIESTETTHFSIMDSEGNAVSSTQSINYKFGSGVMWPGYGIVLNDTMDDFSKDLSRPNIYGLVGSKTNSIEPGKTPMSSMSPIIVFEEGTPILVLGAPGGSMIISGVLQTMVKILDLKMNLYYSVAEGRIHHQYFPDVLKVEAPLATKYFLSFMKEKGYKIQIENNYSKLFVVMKQDNDLIGVSDPRGEGIPIGE